MDSTHQILRKVHRVRNLTRKEEFRLFTWLRNAIRQRKQTLVRKHMTRVLNQYLHWAVFLASRVAWQLPPDELASVAADGLMRAATTFDPDSGCRFITYARHRVKGIARSYAMDEGQYKLSRIQLRETKDRRDEDKYDHECIQTCGVSHGQHQYSELVHDGLEEEVDRRLLFERAVGFLDVLSSLQKTLVLEYYVSGYSLRELANRHGKSHEKIRQILEEAIQTVKDNHDTTLH